MAERKERGGDEYQELLIRNQALQRQVDDLLRAKEAAKIKVRTAIQELVDENKELRLEIEELRAQLVLLLKDKKKAARMSTHQGSASGGLAVDSSSHNGGGGNTTTDHTDSEDRSEISCRDIEDEEGADDASEKDVDNARAEEEEEQEPDERRLRSDSTFDEDLTAESEQSETECPSPLMSPHSRDRPPHQHRSKARMGTTSKLGSRLGITTEELTHHLKNKPTALTMEEDGLIMMMNEYDDSIEIKGGTLEKLVERLYHEDTPKKSPEYVTTFILTYRAFAKMENVLTLLMNAYNAHSNDLDDPNNRNVRGRITKVIEQWAELQQEDFSSPSSDPGVSEFMEFIKTTVADVDGAHTSSYIRKLFKPEEQRPFPTVLFSGSPVMDMGRRHSLATMNNLSNSGVTRTRKELGKSKAPKPMLPKAISKTPATAGSPAKYHFTLEDIEATELARQLTIMHYEIFRRIRPREYNGCAWTKPNKHKTSSHLLAMIHMFNETSKWVQYSILQGKSAKKRALIVDKFVKIAAVFHKLKNYNGVMAIVSAMEAASVHRLEQTFEKVKDKQREKYSELKQLVSGACGYKLLREEIAKAEPPVVPYMGMYLTDFTNMEEGQKNTLEPKYPNYLNFEKRMMIAKAMKSIAKQQSAEYALAPVESIRSWLKSQIDQFGNIGEDQLYQMSQEVEPREADSTF